MNTKLILLAASATLLAACTSTGSMKSGDDTLSAVVARNLFGPDKIEAQILFGVFTGARLLFSFAYLKGLQPWRTISFLVGVLTTLALTIEVCRLALS